MSVTYNIPKSFALPKGTSDVDHATLTTVRKWYKDISDSYKKIITGKYVKCPMCGEWMPTANNFFTDNRFVDGIFYICKNCVTHMAEQRASDEFPRNETKESIQHVLRLMDLPYIDELYNSCKETVDNNDIVTKANKDGLFTTYYSCLKGLKQYSGKTWNDSIFSLQIAKDDEEFENEEDRKPRRDIVRIFGNSFSNDDLLYLQDQYDDWRSRTQVDTKSQEIYVTQICLQSLEIYNDRKNGVDVTNKLKALDTLMSSANLQPKQNVGNAATDSLVFGQLIEKWEQEKPISEPSEEFKDVDGIGKLIRVWVTGWLAKAIGIKNIFTKEFEDETNKYTVSKQNVKEDEISEDIYSKLFGDGIE